MDCLSAQLMLCSIDWTHLEHLGSTDDRLSSDVTLGDHHLLSHKDLTGRDLDTQITSGDHDTISLLQDLVKVGNTLLILNLDNDLDLGTFGTEDLSDLLDIITGSDEGSKDHVDIVLDTECQIGLVLFGKGG